MGEIKSVQNNTNQRKKLVRFILIGVTFIAAIICAIIISSSLMSIEFVATDGGSRISDGSVISIVFGTAGLIAFSIILASLCNKALGTNEARERKKMLEEQKRLAREREQRLSEASRYSGDGVPNYNLPNGGKSIVWHDGNSSQNVAKKDGDPSPTSQDEAERLAAASKLAQENALARAQGKAVTVNAPLPRKMAELYASLKASANKSYGEYSSLSQVKTDLINFANSFKLQISEKAVIDLLASMASTRLVAFDNSSKKSEAMLYVASAFFGNNVRIEEVGENWNSFDEMIYSLERGEETEVVYGMCSARIIPNNVSIVALTSVNPERFKKYFAGLVDFISTPELEYDVQVGFLNRLDGLSFVKENHMVHPHNVWYFVSLKDDSTKYFTSDLGLCSSLIKADLELPSSVNEHTAPSFDLNNLQDSFMEATITQASDAGGNFEILKQSIEAKRLTGGMLSYRGFEELVDDCVKNRSPELDDWKKYDKIAEYLENNYGIKLGNKAFRQLERYISVHMEMSGSFLSALDSALAAKVLPLLKNCGDKMMDGGAGLKQLLDGIFGENNAECCIEVLNSIANN